MLFPLRAALVIGAIFYFSPVRQPVAPPPLPGVAQAVAALPPQARADAARAGLQMLAGQAGGQLRAGLDGEGRPAPPSRDTLRVADRHQPWQGTAPAPATR